MPRVSLVHGQRRKRQRPKGNHRDRDQCGASAPAGAHEQQRSLDRSRHRPEVVRRRRQHR